MAVVTLLGTATFNTTAGNKTVTATPAVNDLIVVVAGASGTSEANAATTSVTDNQTGGTYVKVADSLGAGASPRISIWIRTGLIGSATSTVFTASQGSSSGGGLAVLKVTGMTRVGFDAGRQYKGAFGAGGTTPTVSFTAACLTGNAVIEGVVNGANPATLTPPASHTERVDTGYATPTTGLEVASRDSGETGSTITWGGSSASAWRAAAVELNTATDTNALGSWRPSLADVRRLTLRSAGGGLTAPPRSRRFWIDSVAGSDSNSGMAPTSPWQTTAKATSFTWLPGDEFNFKAGGTYDGMTVPASGTAAERIIIQAYGTGDRPLFHDGGTGAQYGFEIAANYITLIGVRGAQSDFGFYVPGANNNVTLIDCEGDTNAQQGCLVIGDTVSVIGGRYHHNGTLSTHHGIYFGAFGGAEASAFLAQLVEADNNLGAGIQCFLAAGGTIERCRAHDNGAQGLIVSNAVAGSTINVYTNLCYGNLIGLEIEQNPAGVVVNTYQNTLRTIASGVALYLDTTAAGSGVVKNNIIDGTGGAYAAAWGAVAGDIVPHSNILHRNDAGNLVNIGGTDYTESAFYTALGGNPDPTYNFIGSDPRFLGGVNFHVIEGSAALNAGDNLGITPDLDGETVDATPDLGVFQGGEVAFAWAPRYDAMLSAHRKHDIVVYGVIPPNAKGPAA